MRKLLLTALFAVGVGLAGIGNAPAATIGGGLADAANSLSSVESVVLVCRRIEVCRRTPAGRICRIERVCRDRW